uniref:Uncharacterized protein n=1 Tax=Rangifer tarandus platyrhynchus TaxID=3082113 RepID=A0ACB0F138_RANTA|nr:unnamed protein product [Rangifer tarandus platyrhynchus]
MENSAGAQPPRSPLRPRPTSGTALEPARNPGAGGPGGLSRSSPQFGGLTAPVRVFPRVSRSQGAAPRRARHSRGESLAPMTRGPIFEIPGRRPGALGYRTHPPPATPAPPAQPLRWPCPVPPAALGQPSARSFLRLGPAALRSPGDAEKSEQRPPRPSTGHRSRSRTVAALPTSAQADMQRQGGGGGDSKLEMAVPRLLRRENGRHPRALSAGHPKAPVTATRSPDAAPRREG